jgi:hypothetical protein
MALPPEGGTTNIKSNVTEYQVERKLTHAAHLGDTRREIIS